jgi:Mg2+/Co2+ transporter CorC
MYSAEGKKSDSINSGATLVKDTFVSLVKHITELKQRIDGDGVENSDKEEGTSLRGNINTNYQHDDVASLRSYSDRNNYNNDNFAQKNKNTIGGIALSSPAASPNPNPNPNPNPTLT